MWLLLALIPFAACQRESADVGPVEWAIDPTPRFSIGDTEDSDTTVFAVVSDARRMSDGLIVVADGAAKLIITFDSTGARVSTAGRPGRGPAEFSGGLSVVKGPGDSAAVWDSGMMRWTLVAARTGGMRNLTDPLPTPTWLHAGIMIHSERASPPAWLPRALMGISAESPEVRLARLDERGVLWVSQDARKRHWKAYIDSAPPIAAVTIPEGVEPLQFGDDEIVGIATDSLGLQRVVMHSLTRMAHKTVDLVPAPAGSVDLETRRELMSTMRHWVMAQEVHYSQTNGYTMSVDSLDLTGPVGTRFKILEADARGWRGVAWFPATGYTCAMTIGMSLPAGWGEGSPQCGWGN